MGKLGKCSQELYNYFCEFSVSLKLPQNEKKDSLFINCNERGCIESILEMSSVLDILSWRRLFYMLMCTSLEFGRGI